MKTGLFRQSSLPIPLDVPPTTPPFSRGLSEGNVLKTEVKRSISPPSSPKIEESSNPGASSPNLESPLKEHPKEITPTRLMKLSRMASRRKSMDQRNSQETDETDLDINVPLRQREQKRIMDQCIRSFNLNPKVGMKYYKEKLCNKKDPAELVTQKLALFLKNTPGLNKTLIGTILGADEKILKEYVSTFDFRSFPISVSGVEAALRHFLTYFKPPGESQQIDRILEAFSERFSIHSTPVMTKDSIHQLSFVIIILNVALHNPALVNKIKKTKEEIVHNHAKDLESIATEKEISDLYDSIEKAELKHVEDREDVTGNLFTEPDMLGWLDIRMYNSAHYFPKMQSRWKKRFVILSQNTLFYFKKSTSVDFEGFIPLQNLRLFSQNGDTSSPASVRGSLRQNSQFEEGSATIAKPPLIRNVSCPAFFSTSQSSLSSKDSASRFSASEMFSSFNSKRDGARKFLLLPCDPQEFVKAAKLSKFNRQVKLQQQYAVAFKCTNAEEYENWILALRRRGLSRFVTPTIARRTSSRGVFNTRLTGSYYPVNEDFEEERIIEEPEGEEIPASRLQVTLV